jgi:LmbE family N-acetylglucosaminyl deacetylase
MTALSDDARLLILVAHPDDAEFHAGGLATIYRQMGRTVKFISVTDGGAGHHQLSQEELVPRRTAEAKAAANQIGAECEVWYFPDAHLQPTLELRHQIIREIREFQPQLVLSHRTCDYHPDHRAVAMAVQDASYLVTVPLVCPEQKFLATDPVVAYMVDTFTRPNPLRTDFVLDIEPYLDSIVQMLACHESQVFEFLPFNHRVQTPVPNDAQERIKWLDAWYRELIASRTRLTASDATSVIAGWRWIEAYEISEYAGRLDKTQRERLFPNCQSGNCQFET